MVIILEPTPTYYYLEHVMEQRFQENYSLEEMMEHVEPMIPVDVTPTTQSLVVEIHPKKTLNINLGLSTSQKELLIHFLQEQSEAFSWEYIDIKGIQPDVCTHHIYIRDDSRPVRQPQHRMNPTLRDIVKEEL